MKKPLIIITGPTASGKSSLAIDLAKIFSGEIVSADSMQIYKHMNIGTAKATTEEMQGIPHHMISFLEPDEEFSVADYTNLAKKTIDEIHDRGNTPFLVGGTTLYIQAIIDNIQFFEIPKDEELRCELIEFSKMHGNEKLWNKLNQIDPELAKNLHFNNQGRIIRGIESYHTTGKPLSYWQNISTFVPSPYKNILLGTSYENREILYDKINQRVDEMISKGLLSEINNLKKIECSKTAFQAIGYKELWNVNMDSEFFSEAVEKLKMNTRRYAKRQLTWMRSRDDLTWIFKDESTSVEILEKSSELIKNLL